MFENVDIKALKALGILLVLIFVYLLIYDLYINHRLHKQGVKGVRLPSIPSALKVLGVLSIVVLMMMIIFPKRERVNTDFYEEEHICTPANIDVMEKHKEKEILNLIKKDKKAENEHYLSFSKSNKYYLYEKEENNILYFLIKIERFKQEQQVDFEITIGDRFQKDYKFDTSDDIVIAFAIDKDLTCTNFDVDMYLYHGKEDIAYFPEQQTWNIDLSEREYDE